MQDTDICALLALHRTSHLSDSMLRRLLGAVATPQQIFSLGSTELNSLEIDMPAQRALAALAATGCKSPRLEQDWQMLQQQGIQLLPVNAYHYPELLKEVCDPPPLLYVKGDPALLNRPQLAMVGSRHSSCQGGENAFLFARQLAAAGFVVTSGLALGIDTHSHRGALAADGRTVAVLGTGVDVVYPSRNRGLFDQLIDQGAIVSEFPLGTPPARYHFPKRNRLISGMSLGVLVVEAALKSGSLITARCALEQGREVFAIPGSIHSSVSRGCHQLIQHGAKLVETTEDVLEELKGWLPEPGNDKQRLEPLNVKPAALDVKEAALMKLLGYDPASFDVLQQRSGWPVSELIVVLTRLETKGLVENVAGRYLRPG